MVTASSLRIAILQTNIRWEDKRENLRLLRAQLEQLHGQTEIAVLPEAFSTGFSMEVRRLAEPMDGETVTTLKAWAAEFQVALAGSYMACEVSPSSHQLHRYFNRAFFITPEGTVHHADKRHLFRMGHEGEYYTPGTQRPIIRYKGCNICLLVCYDLRFPVWSRNVRNEYDLLLYVANWPATRRTVWDVLLQARALENQCYACGVNRTGTDGNGLAHNGGSKVYSPKGELLAHVPDDTEGAAIATLDLDALHTFRKKFPVWADADTFNI